MRFELMRNSNLRASLLGMPASARAAEVRHQLGQTGALDEAQRSPTTGLPLGCCRIRLMAIV
jgi:hypothetical protein